MLKIKVQNRSPVSEALSQKGAILIEALIAMILTLIGIVAFTSLSSNLTKLNSESFNRLTAYKIAEAHVSKLAVSDLNNVADYIQKESKKTSAIPDGTVSLSLSHRNIVKVTVTWAGSDSKNHKVELSAAISDVYSN